MTIKPYTFKKFILPVLIIILIIVFGICYEIFLKPIMPVEDTRLRFSRALCILTASLLILATIFKRQKIFSSIRDYFLAKSHPLNLAIFRIVLFGYLLSVSQNPFQQTLWFSQLPKELMSAPYGMGWIADKFFFDDQTAILLVNLYYFFCFTALVGLYARISAFIVAVLGIYVIGLPGFFGFMYHYHHLLWFSLLLAFSRCSDFLSCDAVIRAWRRADCKDLNPPQPSLCYSLPLRFIWILIGIIYFFPGFWKIWRVGLDWAMSENVKYLLYFHLSVDDRTSIIAISQFPFLYKFGGLMTIIFELFFIFLVFSNTFRYVAVVGGFVFHFANYLALRVPFLKLQICYVVFFDWYKIFRNLGRAIFTRQGQVIYNDKNKFCRRIIASFQVLDIFGHLKIIKLHEAMLDDNYSLKRSDFQHSRQDIHYALGCNYYQGYSAFREMVKCVPILWIFLPFLYLWPFSNILKNVYQNSAGRGKE